MSTSVMGTSGVRLVVNLNFDLVFYMLTLAVALVFGAWLGSVV
jgi:hypothetical protein